MTGTLRVGIVGLGTVGCGVVDLLRANGDLIAQRAGRPIEIVAVSARTRDRVRPIDISSLAWLDDPRSIVRPDAVDVVCELVGGEGGTALEIARSALGAGIHLVTANKAMVAHHGGELATLAEASGAQLAFEAAVAGGIPVLKGLREGLAANRIERVAGILNGTCNYILTTMRETGRDFAAVLAEAQQLGYAEADPSFDIDGIDAAHKLALLAAIAFGGRPRFDAVHIEGISGVRPLDIAFAGELGYRIKLLGVASLTEHGLEQRVHPTMVPADGALGRVEGVFNAVLMSGDRVGEVAEVGRGAGAGPTASAVVGDLIDLARGVRRPAFGVAAGALAEHPIAPITTHRGSYYIRLIVVDRPGVLADVSAVLRDHDISIEALIQRGRNPGQAVPIVLTSHETGEAAMQAALLEIGGRDSVLEAPLSIRIERA